MTAKRILIPAVIIIPIIILSLIIISKIPVAKNLVDIKQNINTTAKINYKGMDITAKVQKTGTSLCVIDITEPENLNGMHFEYSENGLKISYMGLEYKLPDNYSNMIPSMAIALIDSINTAVTKSNVEISQDKDYLIFQIKDKDYKLYVDKNTGDIKSFESESLELSCQFENNQ